MLSHLTCIQSACTIFHTFSVCIVVVERLCQPKIKYVRLKFPCKMVNKLDGLQMTWLKMTMLTSTHTHTHTVIIVHLHGLHCLQITMYEVQRLLFEFSTRFTFYLVVSFFILPLLGFLLHNFFSS